MKSVDQPIRVAVIRGGPSSQFDISLKTGASVLSHLHPHHTRIDIFIDRDGVWHKDGFPTKPVMALRNVDVVFNALHGEYGEDGKVQRLLESLGIPFTGSKSLSAALAMNKEMSKHVYKNHELRTPPHITANDDEDIEAVARHVFFNFHMPVVIKPVGMGSSVGATLATSLTEVVRGLEEAFRYSPTALIEMYISGKEATCGVVEDFRAMEHYTPIPIEIIHSKSHDILRHQVKNSGQIDGLCPPRFSDPIKQEIQRMARIAHQALGMRHYSRSDFRITPTGKVYILETNALPSLSNDALLVKSLEAIGCPVPHFLDHVLALALQQS